MLSVYRLYQFQPAQRKAEAETHKDQLSKQDAGIKDPQQLPAEQ
jgi:hypothetical protein